MGHASKLADLSTFETESLPLRNAAAISNPYSNAAPSVPFEYLLAPCRQLIHQAASCVAKAPPFRKSPTLSIHHAGEDPNGDDLWRWLSSNTPASPNSPPSPLQRRGPPLRAANSQDGRLPSRMS